MTLTKALPLMFVIIVLAILGFGQRKGMEKRKTLPALGHEGPFSESRSSQLEKVVANVRPTPVDSPRIAGSLAVYMMRDPSFESFSRGLAGEDRFLGLHLEGDEWGSLFLKTLKCPDVTDVPKLVSENRDEWERRYSLKFRAAIPNLQMLARLWDLFIYVSFKSDEIERLRTECLQVQTNVADEMTGAALSKILSACDEASKHESGLLFVPD